MGGEVEDVISILTEHRTIEYDREGFWLSEHVRVGVWITIERIKAVCITPTGPLTTFIDVKITCDPERSIRN